MKQLKLQAVRLIELAQVIDSISPKELTTIKDIRLNVNLVNDLNEANKELSTKVSDFQVKRNELLKPVQAEYKEKEKELDEEGKKKLAEELDKKFNEDHKEEFEAIQKEITELSEKELTVELSDEKHEKLKEWFTKYATDKYTNKKIYVLVADALGIED
jgi:seryl-tRNA synthetase